MAGRFSRRKAGQAMTGSAAALQKGLFEALRDDAELAVLLGGKRIHDRVPPKTPFPYVTLGETVSREGRAVFIGASNRQSAKRVDSGSGATTPKRPCSAQYIGLI